MNQIVSNQARCRKCRDAPFSTHRHDYKMCKCGSMAVDGGMEYLKRVGDPKLIEEMAITLPKETFDACMKEAQRSLDTHRNNLGIVCAIMRAIRDTGMVVRNDLVDPRDLALDACHALIEKLGDEGYIPSEEFIQAKRAISLV